MTHLSTDSCEKLRSYITRFVSFDEQEWNTFSSLFTETRLKKGDFFAREGQAEKNIGFLLSGVARAFYRTPQGVEYNKTFFTGGEFIGAYASLVTGRDNLINIQMLTDCELLTGHYTSFTALFARYRNIETLARLIAESFYVAKEKREVELVLLNAPERYQIFKAAYPGLENLIPQYHIASYLGVTPTQLSRIRAKK